MNSIIRTVIASIFLGLAGLTYALDCQPNLDNHPDALVEVKGASDVSYLKCQYPSGWQPAQITYNAKIDCPAAGTIQEISDALNRKGWQALKKDLLKPSRPPSKMWSWERQAIALKNGGQMLLYSWSGEWKNKSGDFVNYVLSYTASFASGTLVPNETIPKVSDLEVMGIYVRADQVKLIDHK